MVRNAGRSVADAEEAVFPILPTMMLVEAWLNSHDRERVPGLVAPDILSAAGGEGLRHCAKPFANPAWAFVTSIAWRSARVHGRYKDHCCNLCCRETICCTGCSGGALLGAADGNEVDRGDAHRKRFGLTGFDLPLP
jgi:hypothetical protein